MCSLPMPIRIHHASRLTNLPRNQRQLLRRQSDDIHFNVQQLIGAEFSTHTPWQTIQILQSLENSSQCTRIRVSNHPKAAKGQFLRIHTTHSSYDQPATQLPPSPGFQ